MGMKLYLVLFAVSLSMAGYCKDFTVNSPDCLADTTANHPSYSNGRLKEVGMSSCKREIEYSESDVINMQGLDVSVMMYRLNCRKIESIEQVDVPKLTKAYRVNESCCKLSTSCSGCNRGYVDDEYRRCLAGIGSYGYSCKVSYDSTYYEKMYVTTYSDSLFETYDFSSGIKYVVRESANAFLENDTIEVYREDGTLRYRGVVKHLDGGIATKGSCYDKKGIKPSRKTNNADLCK